MTAPALDTRQHVAALKAAVSATLGADRVYRFGDIEGKTTMPPIYALLAVERRFAPSDRQGMAGRSGWRVSVRYVGRSASEAEWAEFKVGQALDGVRLTIDGHTSTPVAHESTTTVEPDSGRFSGLSSYTYAI